LPRCRAGGLRCLPRAALAAAAQGGFACHRATRHRAVRGRVSAGAGQLVSRTDSLCTRSVSRASTSGLVSGSTPCPRLNTCPRRPGPGPARPWPPLEPPPTVPAGIAGSRLPCSAFAMLDPAHAPRPAGPASRLDHVRAGLAHHAEQFSGRHAEVDPRHTGIGERLEDPLAVRQDSGAVVFRATAPAHESNSWTADAPAAIWIRRNEIAMSASRPSRAFHMSDCVHERLGAIVTLRRATLDQVRREREWSAGEPDERFGGQFSHERRDRLGHVRHVIWPEIAEPGQVARIADRPGDDRADARLDVDGPGPAL